MTTLKASKQGLARIKQAREKKGWPVADRNWLEAASLFLGVNWEKTGYLAEGISEGTWSRFLAGKRPINAAAFQAYCTILGLNWEEVVNRTQRLDWDSAPDLPSFYGRAKELATLKQWIVKDRCRLVTILGMEGIGKTALAVRTAEEIQDEFEYVIWRSLRYTPSIQTILADLLKFLFQHKTDIPDNIDSQISKLISYLHKHRCLVILDDFETALKSGELAGRYCEGYEAFAEIIKRVGQERHQSCLVLASGEKPREIAFLEGETLPVRSLSLTGLQETEALEIFREKGLYDQEKWRKLVEIYPTNPLVLKIIAAVIKDSFNGKVGEFLKHNTIYLGYISDILDKQFERLSSLEKEIMHQLAINGQLMSLSQLREHIPSQVSTSEIIYVLESLLTRSLIEKIPSDSELIFTLQPIVIKYVRSRFNR
ncbi:helix-turn-helix domain-containing protein [Aerosakkonema funiforme]|uniref:helix-turn-helix domain-containing protein n=1 Tax=Aerosakkonema funiforme TaxID=1246630 RepID=UPI0035B7D2FE